MNRTVDSPSLQSESPKVDSQAIDVAPLLTTVFAVLGFSARAAGVCLTVDLPLRSLHLLGDRSLLHHVLADLVTNAIHAVGAGGLVTLAARPGGEREVVLELADNGSGILPGIEARIWEPFFTTTTEGTGLDLAIVRSLVKAMGGTVELESVPPRGRRCRLTFPPAPEDPDRRAPNPSRSPARLTGSVRARDGGLEGAVEKAGRPPGGLPALRRQSKTMGK
jgi:signal transduction histidine kinase